MKRTERRHLKENEIEKWTRQARELFEGRQHEMRWTISAVLIIAVVAIGYVAWRERVQTRPRVVPADAIAVQAPRIAPPPAPGTVSAAPYFPTEAERARAALAKF